MEYSIHELSRLSGVTPRTLRWYDQIGLLKPLRIAENGYRYYGPAEVDRLQSILFYRALGVGLARIRACLDSPTYVRLDALREHLRDLKGERARVERLIQSVEETIRAEENHEPMKDEAKFSAFKTRAVEENERLYGGEIRAKYGDAQADAANAALLGLDQEQHAAWTALGADLQAKLEAAVRSGAGPDSETGKEIAALHQRWLSAVSPSYSPEQHRGIAELYILDERFTQYYDSKVPGCACFLRDSVRHWIH